jgi:PilZ domain
MLTTGKKTTQKTSLGGGRRVKKFAKERAVKRCLFVASIEVVDVGTGTKLVARTSEIGLGGCYVDALTPFGIGTLVAIKISRDKGSFHAKAKVVYTDATFGMGLKFDGLDPEQRLVLENWVADIVLADRAS